jgi:hypothetical protein
MTANLQPHQARVVVERDQLNARLINLRAFISAETFYQVEREERKRLIRQEICMTEFVQVLNERIEAFQDDFTLSNACDLSGEGTCEACQ